MTVAPTFTATMSESTTSSLSPTASATLSLGLRKVEAVVVVPALVFRTSFSPELNLLDETLKSLVRRLWSFLLKSRIEFTVISDVTTVKGTTVMNISDAINVAGNPYGLNTTEKILNAFMEWVNPVVSSSKKMRRRLFESTATFDHHSTRRRELGPIFLASAGRVKPKIGRTDVSVNIIAKTVEDADALSAMILLLTPEDIAAGLALVISSNATLRRASESNTTSFTVEVDKSSVAVILLEYRYYYYGVFLDFLIANIRYVVGGAVGFIVSGFLIAFLKRCFARLKASAAERYDASKLAAVAAAKHALKVRIFHSRMRAAFRKLVKDSRFEKGAALRELATEAREAALLARATVIANTNDIITYENTTNEVHKGDINASEEFDVVTAVSDDDDGVNDPAPPPPSVLPLPSAVSPLRSFFALEASLKSESSDIDVELGAISLPGLASVTVVVEEEVIIGSDDKAQLLPQVQVNDVTPILSNESLNQSTKEILIDLADNARDESQSLEGGFGSVAGDGNVNIPKADAPVSVQLLPQADDATLIHSESSSSQPPKENSIDSVDVATEEVFVPPPPPQSQPLLAATFRINTLFESLGGGVDSGFSDDSVHLNSIAADNPVSVQLLPQADDVTPILSDDVLNQPPKENFIDSADVEIEDEFVPPPPPQSQPLLAATFRINTLFESLGGESGEAGGGSVDIKPVSGDAVAASQGTVQGSAAQSRKQLAEAAHKKFKEREAARKVITFKK